MSCVLVSIPKRHPGRLSIWVRSPFGSIHETIEWKIMTSIELAARNDKNKQTSPQHWLRYPAAITTPNTARLLSTEQSTHSNDERWPIKAARCLVGEDWERNRSSSSSSVVIGNGYDWHSSRRVRGGELSWELIKFELTYFGGIRVFRCERTTLNGKLLFVGYDFWTGLCGVLAVAFVGMSQESGRHRELTHTCYWISGDDWMEFSNSTVWNFFPGRWLKCCFSVIKQLKLGFCYFWELCLKWLFRKCHSTVEFCSDVIRQFCKYTF